MDDARQHRLAQNEALFRDVNERIERLARKWEAGEDQSFTCECSNEQCVSIIKMPVSEYERVRSKASRFMVIPGHELPEIERVEESRGYYLIVEKIGAGAEVSEETDPRS